MSFRERTAIIAGEAGMEALEKASVAVYGLGGVGGAAAMDLVRAGIGRIVAMDFDRVQESNLNRLCFAYLEDVGLPKAAVFARRALSINPGIAVEARETFMSGVDAAAFIVNCDIHLDCIDALNPKISLLAALAEGGATFASSLGTAGRLDPGRLRLGTVWESHGCPLAREVRNRLRRRGVTADFPAVWSDEEAARPRPRPEGAAEAQTAPGRVRNIMGSSPCVPQAAGHLLAAWAIRLILGQDSGRLHEQSN